MWIAFCRTTPDELELIALPAVLRMPDNVKDVSLVERLRLNKVWFLDSCERVCHKGMADDSGDATEPNGAAFEWDRCGELREMSSGWFTWEGGLWDADGVDDTIRRLMLGGPDRSWWDIEGFDMTVVHTLQAKDVGVASPGRLKRLLELLDPPWETETRRWLTGLIGEKRRAQMLGLLVAVLVLTALCFAMHSVMTRSARDERAQEVQEDLEKMQLRREGTDAASDGEDGTALDLDPGVQDAADRLYDILDPGYVTTTE